MPLLEGRSDVEVVVWPEDSSCDRAWLLEQVKGAAGVLLNRAQILRVVSTMSVGYEHIDLTELTNRGVKLGYTPDVLTDAVADVTVMLALMAGRNAGSTIDLVQSGQWPKFRWAPFAATLKRLIPFGITSCLYTSSPNSPPTDERDTTILSQYPTLKTLQRVSSDELARSSDVLGTKHLINEEFLRKMKKHSVLINASRGTLVDSDALAKALKEGWIWGAGLDVVEGEPNITLDHPLVKEPRCVILSHIGSASIETRIDMATLAVNNLLAGVFGEEMPAQLKI
ncbi:D-isomer specific 2-hydroxyacid dehydrogenase [Armillaria novae-zelandiae]|uniref:D-isomer specific 2-hydroxyacid dehydrogenase n=1 Tax=Armillaria novae-zelandiae TaxID=153914 RepID=A0AA39P5Z4_9AGAR|nr:D-isomer specific 2-hydroxyacid dehydrogenase [Armillaria novae-zelandiae]